MASAQVRGRWKELRLLVLLSLTCQIILMIFGPRRKYTRGSLINFLVLITYILADKLANLSLVMLTVNSSSGTQGKNHVLQALWALFLLLHLGGPDTITSHSIADNMLWFEYLFPLLIQVTMVLCIYIESWSSSALNFLAIPLFICGIIKFGERIWALRSATPSNFHDSLRSSPTLQDPPLRHIPTLSESECVHQAHSLFLMLKCCNPNLRTRFAEVLRSYSLIGKKKEREEIGDIQQQQQQQSNYAFKLVEIQLGFLYDVLYTKATIIYSLPGLVLRFINVISIVSTLVAFVVTVDTRDYPGVDIVITYCLFFGAISLELYAFFSLVSSDWTMAWLNKSSLQKFIDWPLRHGQKRWLGYLAQQSVLSFCLNGRVARYIRNDVFFRNCFGLELYRQRTWTNVDNNLKELIFRQLLEKQRIYDQSGSDHEVLKRLLSYKGDNVIRNNDCFDEIGWSVRVEYDHSVVIWHVATDICYYSTPDKDEDNNCKASKKLSDYMSYVLLMSLCTPPSDGIITHVLDMSRNVARILHLQERKFSVEAGAVALIQMHRQDPRPWRDQSVLYDACRLASQLQNLRCSWEMICQVWVEMLTYAASQSTAGIHADRLRKGGEFLTHVRLLMANLGLGQEFDIGPPVEEN